MNLYEILVPCRWNDGCPIRTRHHREWDRKVREVSKGLTILKPGKGIWTNEGAVYEERIIPVRVSCTEEEMEQIADITIAHYEQIAVMFYIVSTNCVTKYATDTQVNKFVREDLICQE